MVLSYLSSEELFMKSVGILWRYKFISFLFVWDSFLLILRIGTLFQIFVALAYLSIAIRLEIFRDSLLNFMDQNELEIDDVSDKRPSDLTEYGKEYNRIYDVEDFFFWMSAGS